VNKGLRQPVSTALTIGISLLVWPAAGFAQPLQVRDPGPMPEPEIALIPSPSFPASPGLLWSSGGPGQNLPGRASGTTPYVGFPLLEEDPQVPNRSLVAAGAMGGFLGFLGGAALGVALERISNRGKSADQTGPYLMAIGVGGLAGSAISIPWAVHLANGRRGSFLPSLAGSALFGVLGVAYPGTFFLAPLGMIAVSVRIELATGR
jgi:hypothetical protein